MMKKFLVLMLVLGMSTMASAALQLAVGTDTDPVNSEYTLNASNHLSFGIWTTTNINYLSGFDFLLVATTGGSFNYLSGTVVSTDQGVTLSTGGNAHWFLGSSSGILPANEEGLGFHAFCMTFVDDGEGGGLPIPAGSTLFSSFDFHCDGPTGDTMISLYRLAADMSTKTLVDSVIVHQVIPEPMTMALLGLGGLFLRRRR
jgi:hypothetical protein